MCAKKFCISQGGQIIYKEGRTSFGKTKQNRINLSPEMFQLNLIYINLFHKIETLLYFILMHKFTEA